MFHLENHSGRGGQIVTNVVCTQNQKVRVLEYQGAQTAIKIATVNYITATKYSDIKKKTINKYQECGFYSQTRNTLPVKRIINFVGLETWMTCALHKSITNVSILLVGHADIHVDIHTSFIPMCPFQNN